MIIAQAGSQWQDAVNGKIQKEEDRKWKYPEIRLLNKCEIHNYKAIPWESYRCQTEIAQIKVEGIVSDVQQ